MGKQPCLTTELLHKCPAFMRKKVAKAGLANILKYLVSVTSSQ